MLFFPTDAEGVKIVSVVTVLMQKTRKDISCHCCLYLYIVNFWHSQSKFVRTFSIIHLYVSLTMASWVRFREVG